jgi:hypothetical protein
MNTFLGSANPSRAEIAMELHDLYLIELMNPNLEEPLQLRSF